MKNTPCTHSVMMNEIKKLPSCKLLTVSSIGRSLVGREIPLLRLGHGQNIILYVGTHHGMEWITTYLLLKYVSDEIELYEKGENAEFFEDNTVYVVPMLNPDGVELQINGYDPMNPLYDRLHRMSGGDYSKWQANGRGVDLNHNYNASFREYKTIENEKGIVAGATKFSGEYPESEPETACLCAFIRTVEPSLLIALHTQGGEIYYDFNGHAPAGSKTMAEKMAKLSGYSVSSPEGTASYGGLKDWFICQFDRPGFTIECGRGENPLPLTDLDGIYSEIKGILHGNFFKC